MEVDDLVRKRLAVRGIKHHGSACTNLGGMLFDALAIDDVQWGPRVHEPSRHSDWSCTLGNGRCNRNGSGRNRLALPVMVGNLKDWQFERRILGIATLRASLRNLITARYVSKMVEIIL